MELKVEFLIRAAHFPTITWNCKTDRTPSFRERENFVECTKTPLLPAAELFAQQYLLAFSYLHSASHENPLYMPVVCVQMFTGLVKEAAAVLKVTVMQNAAAGRNCVWQYAQVNINSRASV